MRLIQIDNPSQLGWSHYPGTVGSPSSHNNNSNADWSNSIDWSSNVDELHDRLPSYYTALASSRSAPWMPPASQLVFNKLPAYITDMAPLDAATTSDTACGSVGQPGKKKLNLAEYRTRREKQLQRMQEEEEQQQQIKQEQEEQDQQIQPQETKEQNDENIRVKADKLDKQQCHVKPHQAKESALVKDEPEEGEVEEEEVKEKHKKQQQEVASVKSRRIRSSRSPTRSYSSQSSSSRRCRSSSASSYSR